MRTTIREFRLAGAVGVRSFRGIALLSLSASLLLVACGGGDGTRPEPRVPTSAAAEGWQSITGTVGQASSITPQVLVRDQDGNPLSNVAVTFAVTSGGGALGATSATTNGSGIASAGSWTFGTAAGTQSVRATVASLTPIDFSVTVKAGVPAIVDAFGGATQSGTVGSAVATVPAARVRDQYGNPVPDVAVTFAVTAGAGTVTGATATTDASGIARPSAWTLGIQVGTNSLTATVAGVSTPAVFTATAGAGAPAKLVVDAGNGQSAKVGTAVRVAPRVLLSDAHDNPVAGATITFAVASGGGAATGGSVATDAQGRASVGSWTLGTVAGANTLRASLQGGSLTTDFTATADPDAPAKISLADGPTGSVRVGTVVAPSPAVLVADRFDNPVPGTVVTFTPDAGDGTIANTTATTGVDGTARAASWTLGTIAGTQTLTARVSATIALRIDVAAVSGVPAYMFLESGGDQMARVNTTLPVAPSVSVYDEYLNPVVGQVVTFAPETGAGTVTGGTPVTNAAGIAQVGSWTLGATEGVQRLVVTVPGRSGTIAARAVPLSSFNIEVRYLTAATPAQQQAFAAAVERWSKVIIDDVPDILLTSPANSCGLNEPAMNETVDDLVIFVSLEAIDGAGGILGSASPCYVRSTTLQAITGVMRFDTADLAELESIGQLGDVILHEMGHVLGIGSTWESFGYVANKGTADPYYIGLSGRAGWSLVGGDAYVGNSVPVENIGGTGTADAHWRNSVLGTELMTGFAEPGERLPLSLVTIGGLEDLGYGITAYGYDSYRYGSALRRSAPGSARELREVPLPRAPIAVDASGRVVPIGATSPAAARASNRNRVKAALPSIAPRSGDLVTRPRDRSRR
jgi:hypothetical protein